MNILVVEDVPVNALMLRNILEHDGHRVWMAKTGAEGLEMVDEHPNVELLVVDIFMPEMDGLELVRTLRARDDVRGLPVMFLTSDASTETVRKAVELGAAGYILKPMLEPSSVLSRINEVLAGCPPLLGPAPGEGEGWVAIPSPVILRELAAQVAEILERGRLPAGSGEAAFTRILEGAGAQRFLGAWRTLQPGNREKSPVLLREIRALAAELADRGHSASLHPAG